ncbi:MAG TPA: rod shape-determining protein MreD [Gaiella sp.]
MSLALRVFALVFVVAIVQTSVLAGVEVLGATPDLALVTVVVVALLRGPIVGATAGFVAGLLIDVATLSTLGVTSLLLSVAGYWAGRYGDTTGRGRAYAPYLAVGVIAVLVGVGGYLVHFLLGEDVSAGTALGPVLPSAALDVLLAVPVLWACRRIVGSAPPSERAREMELVV